MIEIVNRISPTKALIKQDGQFYIVSQSNIEIDPMETLVFKSDEVGNVTSWSVITGEVGVGIDPFLRVLMENGVQYKPYDDLPW